MFVKEMNYQDASRFYPSVNLETKVKYYSVFGGVPYYNSYIDETKSFEENMENLIIKLNGPLSDFVELILTKELRKLNNANEVFGAIANGKRKFNDILTSIGNGLTSAGLSYVLRDLLGMDLISKVTPINEVKNSKRTYYEINDNFINFYYRFIFPNLSARSITKPNDFYKEIVEKDFAKQYLPHKFEKLAKEYLVVENKAGRIKPLLLDVGKYWYDNPEEKVNGEFDLVTKDQKGYIVYEVKYTNKKINEAVVTKLKEQLARCKVSYYKMGFISKSGFELKNEQDYKLFSLKKIYEF